MRRTARTWHVPATRPLTLTELAVPSSCLRKQLRYTVWDWGFELRCGVGAREGAREGRVMGRPLHGARTCPAAWHRQAVCTRTRYTWLGVRSGRVRVRVTVRVTGSEWRGRALPEAAQVDQPPETQPRTSAQQAAPPMPGHCLRWKETPVERYVPAPATCA